MARHGFRIALLLAALQGFLLVTLGRGEAAPCPVSCLEPQCVSGDRSEGGQLLIGGLCTYYCSPANAKGQRFCGFGAKFEANGGIDCGACDQEMSAVDAKHQAPASSILDAPYISLDYQFEMRRLNMNAKGQGKLWIEFGSDFTSVRIQGMARSPTYGKGQITVVADGKNKVLYGMFDMENLHEVQCIKYPFPSLDENAARLDMLDFRAEPLGHDAALHKRLFQKAKAFQTKWSKRNDLALDLGEGGMLRSIELRRDSKIVKRIRVDGNLVADAELPPEAARLFEAPSPNCRGVGESTTEVASLQITPPSGRSSALQDMLLAMQKYQGPDSRLFLTLSAFALPGEIAVMIDDPAPPALGEMGDLSFDYSATIHKGNIHRQSNGSVWLDVQKRALHLRGEAKQTKVGPLFLDVLAQGTDGGKLFANVDLSVQEAHQCVAYPYPEFPERATAPLVEAAAVQLRFSRLDQLDGEDCGVFSAPLTRSRTIHVWVDLESVADTAAKAILRTQVRHNDKAIRTTDILRWHSGPGYDVSKALTPRSSWGCSAHPLGEQLATLGVSEVHKRSLELQDALYALKGLPKQFAVLEVLALTGDVAIMVDEPAVPDLGELSGVSFDFTMLLSSAKSPPGAPEQRHPRSSGKFSIDPVRKETRAAVQVEGLPGVEVAVLQESVRVRADGGACVEAALLRPKPAASGLDATSVASVGMFDNVDAVGDVECNKFTFLGSQAHEHNVEMWYDIDGQAVKRMQVLPKAEPAGSDARTAVIDVSSWHEGSSGGFSKRPTALEDWGCRRISGKPSDIWQTLSPTAERVAALSASSVHLDELTSALGVIGLLTPAVKDAFAQLQGREDSGYVEEQPWPAPSPPPPQVRTPMPVLTTSQTTTQAPAHLVDVMSPELRSFSFSFRSTYPLQGVAAGSGSVFSTASQQGGGVGNGPHWHRGVGTMTVDLASRRFFLQSEAVNVSAGIPHAKSQVVFRGDRQRLYSRSRIPSQGFDQCWSVSTAEELPPPPGGVQPNPFVRARESEAGTMMVLGRPAKKYTIDLLDHRRAVLYVDAEKRSLVAINLDDLKRDVSTGVIVKDWSTSRAQIGTFDLGEDWVCDDLQARDSMQSLASWDMMQVFFPLVVEDVQ
eukprot:TRINITY_DN12741_c1_g3_i1.p1 TRINITY_DN12741_c1_g3~~TRINITY_DN12741_c1_g3_i1.p1  ORF type:complete len:1126 (-),score=259.33 TRINITY_DN12741_c1_g3_i1:25-3402(-)